MPEFNPSQLQYGGDYNPDQWSRDVWLEDVTLMREAGVNLVTLGVFAWANIEFAEGDYHFDWLDEIFELLHENGIGVDLATATASPPAWLTVKYPEVLPVTASGTRLSHGGRQGYCASSPIYRERAKALAEQLAKRYGNHPALKMWHVNNEYGCHNPMCFCDVSAASWRRYLRERYGALDELNKAWGTSFWSQRYHHWDEILPPRQTPDGTYPNPSMMLDYYRFSNDEILSLFTMERDAIRAVDPLHPITTNFMTMKHTKFMNYWKWAEEVDFVSTDHYLIADDVDNHIDLAFEADLTRGWAKGKPWLLMEHSTSAVNWQNVNLAKLDGQMLKNSLSHVARGSEGAMFFQWRASVSGSEKFHSAMVSHTGTDSRTWRNVVELGEKLAELSDVTGTDTEPAQVAIMFDYESWWALSQKNLPSDNIDYTHLAHEWYATLWQLGVRVDFVSPKASAAELSKYPLVLAPMLYLMSEQTEAQLIEYAENHGSLVVSYFSGISNERDTVKLGGYGGKLVREILGVFVEEFSPLLPEATQVLSNGMAAHRWSEVSEARGAQVLASFTDGAASGSVAIAKRQGSKPSWYLATSLEQQSLRNFFTQVVQELQLVTAGGNGVEVVKRGSRVFEIDHNSGTISF
ncbi:MAG: hypothetical protein RIS82_710 [Actinomycetota bacterium]|jgi:beta-galactosidase